MSAYGRASRVRPRLARPTAALAFALLTLLPLAVLCFGGVHLAGTAMRTDVESRADATAGGTAAFVEEQMVRLRAAADDAARRHLLLRAVGAGSARRMDRAGIEDQLRQLRTLDNGISDAWLTDIGGRLVAVDPARGSARAAIGRDSSQRDWYRGLVRSGTTYVSPAFRTTIAPNDRVVSVSTWVRDTAGRPVAVLALSYDLSEVRSYAGMAQHQGVRVVVTDSAGTVLAASGPGGNALVSLADDPRVAAARRGRSGVSGGSSREKTVSAYRAIPSLGWTVTAEVPESPAFARVAALRRMIFGTTAVLGLALLFGVAMLHRLGKRQERAARELTEVNGRLEQQASDLVAARELATEASRLKSAFVANMSHEIRTPMNGVLGLTELLSEGDLPASQRELAALAHRSAQALLAVLDDVLDFSKIEAGQLDLEVVDVDLRAVLDDAVRLFARPAAERGLHLSAEVAPEVPETVSSDPTRLRQVLLNLIGNALKFTDQGSVRVQVTREAVLERAEAIRFAVIDTGIGIAPEKQELLFEPFRQAEESTTRRYGGTGLGLAISSQLVVLLGGTLSVDSRPRCGSTFSFTLVLTPPQRGPEIPMPRTRAVTAQRPARAELARPAADGLLLLVAEDNRVNQKVAEGQLASLGYRVHLVEDGLAAVDAVRTANYAAVLMDCQMPRMDGYDATREIRRNEADGRRIPIIAVTASALTVDRERCLAAGMDDHLGKPVRIPQLAETLRRWITPSAVSTLGPASAPALRADLETPLLDPELLADLGTLPLEDLTVVVDEYLTTTAGRLETLRSGTAQPVEFTRIAHSIKGSSASLAAARLAGVAAELERVGRAGVDASTPLDREVVDTLLARLEREFHEVRPVLRSALLG